MKLLDIDEALATGKSPSSIKTVLFGGILVGIPSNVDSGRAGFTQKLVLAVDLDATLETDHVHVEIDLRFSSGDTSIHLGLDTFVPQESHLDGGHAASA